GRSRKWSAVFYPSSAFTSAVGDDLTGAIAPAAWRCWPRSGALRPLPRRVVSCLYGCIGAAPVKIYIPALKLTSAFKIGILAYSSSFHPAIWDLFTCPWQRVIGRCAVGQPQSAPFAICQIQFGARLLPRCLDGFWLDRPDIYRLGP